MTATPENLTSIINRFPDAIRNNMMAQMPRFAFEVDLVRERLPDGATVCDIGGGWGVFALGCAAVGLRPIIVDDWRDPGHEDQETYAAMSRIWDEYGVRRVNRDVLAHGLGMERHSLDAATTFDSLEHWHHSPKKLLHEVAVTLKPCGLIVIATPTRRSRRNHEIRN